MVNLSFITDNLATGGDLPESTAAARRDLKKWQELGITHVVDNRLEWSDAEFVAQWAPEIRYLHNGVDDHGEAMPDEWFNDGVEFIVKALNASNAKVLAHCHMGINRGPSLAYAALLAIAWDPIEAISAIRSARPIAGLGYAEDALDWHHRCQHTPQAQRRRAERRLAAWRRDNWIDVVRNIRSIRTAQAS